MWCTFTEEILKTSFFVQLLPYSWPHFDKVTSLQFQYKWFNSFDPCTPLDGWEYLPTLEEQYLKTVSFFKRIFNKFSNDIQVERLYTCGLPVIGD